MRTVRSSGRLEGCLPRRSVSASGGGVCLGGCLPGGSDCPERGVCRGVCLPRGCLPRGMCAEGCVCPRGCMSAQGGVYPGGCLPQCMLGYTPPPPSWTEWLTHRCGNITFPQLLLRTVKILVRWNLHFMVSCGVKNFRSFEASGRSKEYRWARAPLFCRKKNFALFVERAVVFIYCYL